MSTAPGLPNKYRAAIAVLQKGRDGLIEAIADEIVDQGDDLVEGGFLFHEFLESQGTRLHFLSLLVSQLEQSAECIEELEAVPPPPPPRKPSPRKPAKPRTRKAPQKLPTEGSPEDL